MMINKKILFVLYVIIFVALVTYTTGFIINPHIVTKANFVRNVDVDKKKIFDLMADDKKYPLILPENVISVSIINQTNNIIFTKEVIQESGIKTQLTVKHTVFPYNAQILEIMDGDANGTTITVNFEDQNNQTSIKTNLELHLKGVLTPFGYLPSANLEHAMNTIIDHFVDYLK